MRTIWLGLHSKTGVAYLAAVSGYLALFILLRLRTVLHSVVVIPGTLLHELAHWITGALCGGRPLGLRLWPRYSGGQMVLGSVEFANLRWYNGVFIGLAPLSLLPTALMLMAWRVGLNPRFSAGEAGWAYIIACLMYAAVPSRQDLRIVAISRWMLVSSIGLAGMAWAGHW
ncbi:MAG: hypothetical protein M0Z84_06360 [Gammaproteobacteria bacterium]|nr:hypothetical protein [Gammaproteobacteria bacterium]